MAIEEMPLSAEISAVINQKQKPVLSTWRAQIDTPKASFKPWRFLSLDIKRDYLNAYSDEVFAELLIPLGAYTHDLMPFQEQIQIVLDRIPEAEDTTPTEDNIIGTRTYRAIMEVEEDGTIAGSAEKIQNREVGDISNMVRVRFQLLDASVEQLRLHQVGGIYRNTTPGNVIKFILNDVSQRIDVPEEEAITGVKNVEWDNKDPYPHIVIPHGTRVQDVSAYVQNNWGGVYNTGCGCYLQNGLWYIWPEYNLNRFDNEKQTLMLVMVPSPKYRGIERTYRQNRYQTIALVTGQTDHRNLSHHQKLNQGNATRYTRTDQMSNAPGTFEKNFGQAKGNKFTIKRGDNNTEYSGISNKNYDVAPVSPRRLTNNALRESSQLAARQGAIMTVVWENMEPNLVYPGMPTRVMYSKQNEVREVDAVILQAHAFIHDRSPGPVQGRMTTNMALTLYVSQPVEPDTDT